MNMLQPLNAAPFESEDDLCRVLATLREAPLCDMLEYAALTSRANWLAAALKVGVLQVLLDGCPQAAARLLVSPRYETFFAAQFDVAPTRIAPLMVALIFQQPRCASILYAALDPQDICFEHERQSTVVAIANSRAFVEPVRGGGLWTAGRQLFADVGG